MKALKFYFWSITWKKGPKIFKNIRIEIKKTLCPKFNALQRINGVFRLMKKKCLKIGTLKLSYRVIVSKWGLKTTLQLKLDQQRQYVRMTHIKGRWFYENEKKNLGCKNLEN